MFFDQSATNKKKGNHARVCVGGGGAKYPPPPEIKLNKMKKIAQPTEF